MEIGGRRVKELKKSSFKNKVAVISGAGSGIGRGLAMELARKGATVAISDINVERLEEVKRELDEMGAVASERPLDVTDSAAFEKMAADIKGEYGRIDYLFNNAGIVTGGQARDISLEDWRKVIDINLFGVIHGVHSIYPIMVKQGFGHIVNMGSILGLIPTTGVLPYNASKFGVVGLSLGLRMEGEPLGVKVSVACPGYIDTMIFKDAELVKIDGSKAFKTLERSNLMSAEKCAREILRGVARNDEMIVVTDLAKIAWFFERLMPPLVRMITRLEMRDMNGARIADCGH